MRAREEDLKMNPITSKPPGLQTRYREVYIRDVYYVSKPLGLQTRYREVYIHDVYSICTYSVKLESLGVAAAPLTMSLGDGVVCDLPARSQETVANEAHEDAHSDGSV